MIRKPMSRVSIAKRAAAIKKKVPVIVTKKVVVRPIIKPKKVMVRSMPRPVVKKPVPRTADIQKVSIDKKLIDNFISTQRVLVNLSVKFDNLASQISKLVELFEVSAKSLAKKDFDIGGSKEIKDRLDSLVEQNKLIARGLSLMHDRVTGPGIPPSRPLFSRKPMQKHIEPPTNIIQPPKPQEPAPPTPSHMPGYEKSLSSDSPQQFKKLKDNPQNARENF